MIKKLVILIAIVCLFSLFCPGAIQAQSTANISSSVEADFPTKITFNITAESTANITDIRLRYSVTMAGFAESFNEVYLTFTPSARVTTNWVWDMRQTGGLPPGTEIVYWWQVTDATGNIEESLPARLIYEDTRYSWQKLVEGKATVLWYEGDKTFAQALMTAVKDALARLASDTGAEPMRPFRIYVYATNADYQGAFVFPTEWSGGVTFNRFDIILIGIPTSQLTWGERAITHELTHLVVGQITLNPYNSLPPWLDEGLATNNEGPLDPNLGVYLTNAIKNGTLISVQSLSSPFSAISEQAYLSYAESFSIINYLISQYGQQKMLQLLDSFKQGSTYDEALEQAFGLNIERLNTQWQEYVVKQPQSLR